MVRERTPDLGPPPEVCRVYSSEPAACSPSFHTYPLLHFPRSPGSHVESCVAATTSYHGPLPFVASTVPTMGGHSRGLTPPALRPCFRGPDHSWGRLNSPFTHFLLAPDTPPQGRVYTSLSLCLHCTHAPHPPPELTHLVHFTEKIKVS